MITTEEAVQLIIYLQDLTAKEFYGKTPEDLLELYQEENTIGIPVECSQCNFKHILSERVEKINGALTTYHCPKCSHQGYHYN